MMKKIGKYTGREYENIDVIEECCFNVNDVILQEDLQAKKEEHRYQCMICALSCNYSAPCQPCRAMNTGLTI